MDRPSRFVSIVVLLGFLPAPCLAEKALPKDPSVAELLGKPAPSLTADAAHKGVPVSLGDLKGKVVLLDFWAVWCPPCVRSFPQLREWHNAHHDSGLEIVGVTYYNEVYGFDRETGSLTTLDPNKALTKANEQEMLRHFAAHHKLDYRLWAVDKADWNRCRGEYKQRTIPTMVLIDRKGNVRLIRSGTSEEAIRDVDAMLKVLLSEK